MGCGCGQKREGLRRQEDEGVRKWLLTTRTFSARIETDLKNTILCPGVHLASWRGKPLTQLIDWVQSTDRPQLVLRRML